MGIMLLLRFGKGAVGMIEYMVVPPWLDRFNDRKYGIICALYDKEYEEIIGKDWHPESIKKEDNEA